MSQINLYCVPWFSRIILTLFFFCHVFHPNSRIAQADEALAVVEEGFPPIQDLFRSGSEGYAVYRIPAIVSTNQGTLLAFAEGRTSGDSGPIDVVLKRSTDGGKTWGPLQVVWDDGENTCGNPCPVVDRTTGKIWMLLTWNHGQDDEGMIMAGKSHEVRHVYVTQSSDDGLTWATPVRISDQVRRPHWRWYATGPGNGIQLEYGEHRGRLLMPCNHSDHTTNQHPYRSHVVYSDDHGVTWKLGGLHGEKTNESVVAERSNGHVLQAMRSYHGRGLRAMSISRDGGTSWESDYLEEDLVTPVCQASMIARNIGDRSKQPVSRQFLFSSPHGKTRKSMSIWISSDQGESWPIRKLIYPGSASYSNLIELPNQSVGLIFERGSDEAISFTTVTDAWLGE